MLQDFAKMELFRTESHYIFVKERHSLWCEKYTAELSAKSGEFIAVFNFFSIYKNIYQTFVNIFQNK